MDHAVEKLLRKGLDRYGGRTRNKLNRWMAPYSRIGDPEVFETSPFDWTAELENNWQAIAAEADKVMALRHMVPPLGEVSPDHKRLDPKRSWRSFFLWGYGLRLDMLCDYAPVTARLVDKIPGLISAFYSIHEPGTHLPRHKGVTKGMITCHLGLRIPKHDGCRMNVEGKTYHWQEGKFLIFDDTYYHEVWNDSDEDRVILLIHVKRPMRAPASWLRDLFFWVMRRTPFVTEARRNTIQWAKQFVAAVNTQPQA